MTCVLRNIRYSELDVINLYRGLYNYSNVFRSISTFRWKYTNMNVNENCQQNEIFEGKFIKSWWNILEQMRRKVNPAPDGVDDSHIRSERKIQVAKLQIIFRKSLEQQRSHLWQKNQEGIRLFRVYTLLHRILSCIIKVSLVQERVRIIWISVWLWYDEYF